MWNFEIATFRHLGWAFQKYGNFGLDKRKLGRGHHQGVKHNELGLVQFLLQNGVC